MIKGFVFIIIADTCFQIAFDKFFQSFDFSIEQCLMQRCQVKFHDSSSEPFYNGIFVDIANLHIGNRHSHIHPCSNQMRIYCFQVSCKEQEIPQIILWIVNIFVGDILMNRLGYGLSRHDIFQLCSGGIICFLYHFFNDAVRRGVRPIRSWIRYPVCNHTV